MGYHPDYVSGLGASGNPLIFGSEDQMFRQRLVTNLGGAFVFLFYFYKFSQWPGTNTAPPGFHPKPTRHFTTWLRYIGWAGIYGFFMVVCYGLLVLFPTFFLNLFNAYANVSPVTPGFFNSMVTGVEENPSTFVPYAVILLTVFWSGSFSHKEQALRQNLQEHALIPIEANRLITYYWRHTERFSRDPLVIDDVIENIPDSLISHEPDLQAEKGDLEQGFIQCEYLMHQIADFKENRLFAKPFRRYEKDIVEAESKLNALRVELQNYKMELLESLASSSGLPDRDILDLPGLRQAWKTSAGLQSFERRYFKKTAAQVKESVGECLKFILGIVVCLVLAIGKSCDERHNMLARFGLDPPEYCGPVVKREDASRVLLGVVFTIVICSMVYYVIDKKLKGAAVPLTFHPMVPSLENAIEILEWSLYGVCMHLLGVMGGYFVQRWQSEQRRLLGNRDSGRFIFSDYLSCGVFGFCLNVFLFSVLLFPRGQLAEFQTNWLWAFVPSATAMFTGFYMTRKQKIHRAKCVVLMAVQGATTALFSAGVLFFVYYDAVSGLSEVYPAFWAFCLYAVLTAFFTGVVISFVLLGWIQRQNSGGRAKDQARIAVEHGTGGEL